MVDSTTRHAWMTRLAHCASLRPRPCLCQPAKAAACVVRSRDSGGRGRGLSQGAHRLDLGAGETADDDRVQRAFVSAEGVLGGGGVGGGDADGALGLAEAVEVVAVALVEI